MALRRNPLHSNARIHPRLSRNKSGPIPFPHLGFLDRRTFSKQSRHGSTSDLVSTISRAFLPVRCVEYTRRSICSARVMPSTPSGVHSDESNHVNHASITTSSNSSDEDGLTFAEVCAKVHGKVDAFLKAQGKSERVRAVQDQTRRSLGCIEEALQKYSLDELSLSYNGGKDCLVLLILYLTALHTHYGTNASSNNHTPQPQLPSKLNSVFILAKHPFEEVDAFVNVSARRYHLSLSRYAKPMREAFADYLLDHLNIRAIFVGTRRTDPHGENLTFFDRTDRGWPDFMRIHPVIDWHYAEIWTFIRELGVEYCTLYDLGYTSLGGTTDTFPNPALAVPVGGEGTEERNSTNTFRPAYELIEDEAERLGRDR